MSTSSDQVKRDTAKIVMHRRDVVIEEKDLPVVYFITGIELKPLSLYHERYIEYMLPHCKGDREALQLETRTLGFHTDPNQAFQWVLDNAADIAEGGTHQWIVIEGIKPGLYVHRPIVQVFFEFQGDWETDGHYVRLEGWPPELLEYYESHHLVQRCATVG